MLERRLRLYTGLILAAYVVSHLVNHSLGLASLDAMEEFRRVNAALWQSPPGTVALYGAFIVHAVLGLYALALLLPVLALIGFARAGTEVLERAADPDVRTRISSGWSGAPRAQRRFILSLEQKTLWSMAVLLALVLAAREVRRQLRQRRRQFFTLAHPSAGPATAPVGQSMLEALRAAGIAHASVCGGRARCTTCRVRVGAGHEHLRAPQALEATA